MDYAPRWADEGCGRRVKGGNSSSAATLVRGPTQHTLSSMPTRDSHPENHPPIFQLARGRWWSHAALASTSGIACMISDGIFKDGCSIDAFPDLPKYTIYMT